PLVGPRERLPHLIAVRERPLDVLLAAGRNVEELQAAVGGRGHLGVLARGRRAPFAGDEVAHRRLRLARPARDPVLRVAEQVWAERLHVLVRERGREERIGGTPL